MTALPLMMTRGGQSRFTAAQLDNAIDLGIAAIGLTDAAFVSSPTLDKLPGEFKRVTSISGDQVGDDIVHLMIRDESADAYSVRGFGLFLADGTLFATYAQADRLFEKSARAVFLTAIDIAFPTGDVKELRFGNTDFLNPPATTTRKGVVEIATMAEADAGTAGPLAITAALLRRAVLAVNTTINDLATTIGNALDGLAAFTVYGGGLVTGGGRNDTNRTLTVTAATAAEIRTGMVANKAITPKALADAAMLYVVESGSDYRLLSDGTMEQWGTSTVPAVEGAFSLAFKRPFPNECTGVFTITINRGGAVDGQTTIQEVTLHADRADLFLQNHQSTNNDAAGFRWRAWGR